MSTAYELVSTAVMLRKLVRAGGRLPAMLGGGNDLVGEWWRGLSQGSRVAHFKNFNMACHCVDLRNGVRPNWTFDDGPDDGELDRLERAMLDAASKACAASRSVMKEPAPQR